MADWKNLAGDILELVAQRLIHNTDYVSFGAVCLTWRSASLKNHVRLRSQIPVLMIPSNNQQEGVEEKLILYSLTEKRVYNFQFPIPPNNYCRSSTEYGWLVTVDDSCAVRLLNPFSRYKNEIQLPPLTALLAHGTIWKRCLYKAFVSSNPGSTLDFVVLAILGPYLELAFCRPGDKAWTVIDTKRLFCSVNDAKFYKGKFYFVDLGGKLWACDVGHYYPGLTRLTTVASPPGGEYDFHWWYLVESLRDLFQVEKIHLYSDLKGYRAVKFNVYKLDSTQGKWIEVKSLGDRIFFLGYNTSFSILASDIPECKPNCIYFTDDNLYWLEEAAPDFGVFNLEEGSFEPLFYPVDSQPIIPGPPILILPAL